MRSRDPNFWKDDPDEAELPRGKVRPMPTPGPADDLRFHDVVIEQDPVTPRPPKPPFEPDPAGALLGAGGAQETLTPEPGPPASQSYQLYGQFDACAARVVKVYETVQHGVLGAVQAIDCVRCYPHYDTNNEPVGEDAPQAFSMPTETYFAALPLPARHDQAVRIVAVGDIVTLLAGRDGRAYYMSDDLSFAATVVLQDNDGDEEFDKEDAYEQHNGGAGNRVLRVRRLALSSSAEAVLTTLHNANSTVVEYGNVLVVGPTDQHHGYRCGDTVWVHRRGHYFFVVPGQQEFVGRITDMGPDGERDFTTNHYWVQEHSPDLTYDLNTWAPPGGGPSITIKDHKDPNGTEGRFARWIDAVNLPEADDEHKVPVGATVLVTMRADPRTGEPWYAFERGEGPTGPPGDDTVVVVKITGPAQGGGKYDGVIMGGQASSAGDMDLHMPEGMTPSETPCLYLNTDEDLLPTHWLQTDPPIYVLGKIVGMTEEEKPRPIVQGCGGPARQWNETYDPTLGTLEEGSEEPDTHGWKRNEQTAGDIWGDCPIKETYVSRVVYNEAGDKVLYKFLRQKVYAADGRLNEITPETRVTVDTLVPCVIP